MGDQLFTSGRNADFVRAMVAQQVDFLVVGGLAVVFHGCRDVTAVDDLDLMVDPTQENAQRFLQSLCELQLNATWPAQELSMPNVQLPIKRDFYLDVLTPPDGIEYRAMKQHSERASLNSISVRFVSLEDLIELKHIAVERQKEDIEKHQRDLQCLTAKRVESQGNPR